MLGVLTACASMSGRVWIGESRCRSRCGIEIKMSFNIHTGDVVAGYKIISPEAARSGWSGWNGIWYWTIGGDVIVLLPNLPAVRVRGEWLRMRTTLICQRQLADGVACIHANDDDDWLFINGMFLDRNDRIFRMTFLA